MILLIRCMLLVGLLLPIISCAGGGSSASPNGAEAPSVEPLMSEEVRQIYARSCESCHGPNGRGIVGVAPDLRRVPARTVEEWEAYLRQSNNAHPVAQPPPLWLTADEMKTMAEYLTALTQSR